MKAKIRGTNIELDVQPCYDETGYFSGFKDGYEYYRSADLVFPDTPGWDRTDWSYFRREAAKEILAGMLSHQRILYDESLRPAHVLMAISYTDELIKQLKDGKE